LSPFERAEEMGAEGLNRPLRPNGTSRSQRRRQAVSLNLLQSHHPRPILASVGMSHLTWTLLGLPLD
jgi:hypothetical protein